MNSSYDEKEFINKLKTLMTEMSSLNTKKIKEEYFIKILKLLEENENIVFSNYDKWKKFTITVEKKVNFFIKNEPGVKDKSIKFLKKFYRCKAVGKYRNRCKNHIRRDISNHFCAVHKNILIKTQVLVYENTGFNSSIIDKITNYIY
jgi:hypothetical protein